jgi:hypothetical protein
MSIPRLAVVALLAFGSQPLHAQGDQVPSDVSFNLRRSFLEMLATTGPDGHSVGARWSGSFRMGEHSAVHYLSSDCELHVAARPVSNAIWADPAGLVAEPPNVCKSRLPSIRQTGSIRTAWAAFFDDHVTGQRCDVMGFPRIFTEHATGAGAGTSSNPDHVLEIHPALGLTCESDTLDFLPMLKAYPGMARITDVSAAECLANRRLFVRQRGSGSGIRYEFAEQGARGNTGRCGNFVLVEAYVTKEYLRTLSNGGDHVALARVWVGDRGPFPLKIYTYKGTAVDDKIATLQADSDSAASARLWLHGLLTYDYFTILQSVQQREPSADGTRDWRSADELRDFVEISHPLALVVFGELQP